jgi:pimeloyl-ACP methyl ester carboxylesterase
MQPGSDLAPWRTQRSASTPVLHVAYEESGASDGMPVILLHGFPDDPRAYDGTLAGLAELGCRVLVPGASA